MSDRVSAVKRIRAAHPALQEALDYYEGDVGEIFQSARLRRRLGDNGDPWRINFARTPVTAVLDRLEVTHVTAADEQVQELIDRVWEWNLLEQEQHDYHEWALCFGSVLALVWPAVPDDPDEPISEVDITYESPFTTRAFYDPENNRRISHVAKLWRTGDGEDGRYRLNLYYPDRIEKYVTAAQDQDGEDDAHWVEWIDSWREADEGELVAGPDGQPIEVEAGELLPEWPVPNPYDRVPFFPFSTRRGYGRPEHRDAYGPQNIVNKITAVHPEVLDYYAAPQRVWLTEDGGAGADEESDFDDPALHDDDEPREANLNSQPGGLWKLPGGEVEEFAPANAAGFLDPLHAYVEAMAAVTDTPVHKFKGMSGAPSGEALRAAEAGLTTKVRRRQASFGATWVRILQFAVMVLLMEEAGDGIRGDDDPDVSAAVTERPDVFADGPPDVSVTWRPAEAHDDKDRAEALRALDQAAAASIRTRVRKAQPDLSDDEVEVEAQRIAAEQGVPLDVLDGDSGGVPEPAT